MKFEVAVNGFIGAQAMLRNAVKTIRPSCALGILMDELKVYHAQLEEKRKALVEEFGRLPDPKVPAEARYQGQKFIPESDTLNQFKYREAMKPNLETDVDVKFTPLKYADFEKVESESFGAMFEMLFPFFEKPSAAGANPSTAPKE